MAQEHSSKTAADVDPPIGMPEVIGYPDQVPVGDRRRRLRGGASLLGGTNAPELPVLAQQVAALETELARLRQAEQALQQSNDALKLLSETANELLSTERPQEVISRLFEKLSAKLGLETFFNFMVDKEKGKLRLNSYAGIPPEVAADIEWLEYGQAVCGCVARDGARIVAEDIQCSTDVRTDLVRSFGITAYACHPLMARGEVIGTFSFGTSRKPKFEPHELALMQAVCDQVSLAMERGILIADLRQAVRTRDEFLRIAAHELKTPITSLRGFAQLLLRQFNKERAFDSERALRALGVIDQQSEKLARLVTQLLDISRIESGQLSLERRSVELGELARPAVDAVQTTSPNHEMVLRIHEPVWAMADPLRLEQVLRNLLDNAVRFTPEGGRIDVDVWSPEAGSAKVAVRDHGAGIPNNQREGVFDRFFQAHREDHASGIGLGLHISRHIVELHGGSIEVEHPADGGARFVVTLPTVLAEVKRQWMHTSGEPA